jgi:hypothetical protein
MLIGQSCHLQLRSAQNLIIVDSSQNNGRINESRVGKDRSLTSKDGMATLQMKLIRGDRSRERARLVVIAMSDGSV